MEIDLGSVTTSWTTYCQECGELIRWADIDDDDFGGVVDKLIYHMKNDPKCIRERKLKELFGTKKKLSQDYYLR